MARGVKIFCFMLNLKLLFEVVKVLFLLHISSLIISFSWSLGSNGMNALAILCSGCCSVSILCKIFRKEAAQ